MKKRTYHPKRLAQVIGAKIRELRLNKNWSLDILGQITELGRTHLSDIERGKIDASLSTIARIARAFDITVSQLYRKSKA